MSHKMNEGLSLSQKYGNRYDIKNKIEKMLRLFLSKNRHFTNKGTALEIDCEFLEDIEVLYFCIISKKKSSCRN